MLSASASSPDRDWVCSKRGTLGTREHGLGTTTSPTTMLKRLSMFDLWCLWALVFLLWKVHEGLCVLPVVYAEKTTIYPILWQRIPYFSACSLRCKAIECRGCILCLCPQLSTALSLRKTRNASLLNALDREVAFQGHPQVGWGLYMLGSWGNYSTFSLGNLLCSHSLPVKRLWFHTQSFSPS